MVPETVRLIHEQHAEESRAGKRVRLYENRCDEEDAKAAGKDWSKIGLGISSKDSPVDIDIARRTVLKELGLPADDACPGGAVIWKRYREKNQSKWYVKDAGGATTKTERHSMITLADFIC